MSDLDSIYHNNLYFSPDQQDLLLAALSSNNPSPGTKSDSKSNSGTASSKNQQHNGYSGPDMFDSPSEGVPGSGQFGFGSEGSPFGEFDLDHDLDINGNEQLIGDIPDIPGEESYEPGEKRKSLDGREDEESGKKRKEGDEKVSKKPGRKPLTSEPTTKRKAQNRAAQRAFRERKEKHLKDLEVKVDDLEKISRETNHENSRLKAQVERLQVELKEYRKRLSWVSSGNSISPASSLANGNGNLRSQSTYNNNDFSFEFPKFGDLPSAHLARNGSLTKPQNYASGPYSLLGAQPKIPGVVGRGAGAPSGFNTYNSGSQSQFSNPASNPRGSDYRNGGVYSTADRNTKGKFSYTPADQGTSPYLSHSYENPIKNYTDSPSASSDSQQGHISSIGTSPEPTTNSPSLGKEDALHNKNGSRLHGPSECEQEFCKKLGAACGCADNPIPAAMGKTSPQSNGSNSTKSPQSNDGNKVANNDIFFNDDSSLGIDWMVQQNGGQFDPVLFGDYRDPQDAVLSQEFNGFFNDAFQLPDLGNLDNFDLSNPPAPKKDLVSQIDRTINSADDEVVPGEDRSQMLSCNKIWDRLQSMDKFRSGDIDVDGLCTELRTKARCSEGGVVVNRQDVDDIMGRAS